MKSIKHLFQKGVKFGSSCYLMQGYVSKTEDIEALFENMLLNPYSYQIKDVGHIKDLEYMLIDGSFKAGQYTVYFCIADNMHLFLKEVGYEPVATSTKSELVEIFKTRFPGIHAFLQRDNCICVAFIAK